MAVVILAKKSSLADRNYRHPDCTGCSREEVSRELGGGSERAWV